MKLAIQCMVCGETHDVECDFRDFNRWEQGVLIQDAMPYLKPEERELLISGTCTDCFELMFSE